MLTAAVLIALRQGGVHDDADPQEQARPTRSPSVRSSNATPIEVNSLSRKTNYYFSKI